MAATTSTDFVFRFFSFAFACLVYSTWRAVDLLVQVELTGEYERASIGTGDSLGESPKRLLSQRESVEVQSESVPAH